MKLFKDLEATNKKPLSVSRKGLMIQVRLERVNGLRCKQPGITHERAAIAAVALKHFIVTLAVIDMIPTDFHTG
jgi:hypothetical protein